MGPSSIGDVRSRLDCSARENDTGSTSGQGPDDLLANSRRATEYHCAAASRFGLILNRQLDITLRAFNCTVHIASPVPDTSTTPHLEISRVRGGDTSRFVANLPGKRRADLWIGAMWPDWPFGGERRILDRRGHRHWYWRPAESVGLRCHLCTDRCDALIC